MADQDELHQLRRLNLQKATRIRQMGFKSSIHALPPEVKRKLDEFLSWKLSPRKALAELCSLYPKAELPSPKAVEHYRNKHHKATLSKKITLIANKEIEMDLRKAELEKQLLRQIEVVTHEILPRLTKRLMMALDKEDQIGGMPLQMTNSAILPLMTVIRVLDEFIRKNDVHLFAKPKVAPVQETFVDRPETDTSSMEVIYAKLESVLIKRGLNIIRPENSQPTA